MKMILVAGTEIEKVMVYVETVEYAGIERIKKPAIDIVMKSMDLNESEFEIYSNEINEEFDMTPNEFVEATFNGIKSVKGKYYFMEMLKRRIKEEYYDCKEYPVVIIDFENKFEYEDLKLSNEVKTILVGEAPENLSNFEFDEIIENF